MIKVLYEAGSPPDVIELLITVSSKKNCDIGPSNSLLFSTQSSLWAPISAVRAARKTEAACGCSSQTATQQQHLILTLLPWQLQLQAPHPLINCTFIHDYYGL
eukprot:COSAG01_NODE_1959_length_8800_cov_81.221584_4_plen_103_part_00